MEIKFSYVAFYLNYVGCKVKGEKQDKWFEECFTLTMWDVKTTLKTIDQFRTAGFTLTMWDVKACNPLFQNALERFYLNYVGCKVNQTLNIFFFCTVSFTLTMWDVKQLRKE